jgi:hypothetical protein
MLLALRIAGGCGCIKFEGKFPVKLVIEILRSAPFVGLAGEERE